MAPPIGPSRTVRFYSRMNIPPTSVAVRGISMLLAGLLLVYMFYMADYVLAFLTDAKLSLPGMRFLFPRSLNDPRAAVVSSTAALRRNTLLGVLFFAQYILLPRASVRMWVQRFVPTFNYNTLRTLAACVSLHFVLHRWYPMPGEIFNLARWVPLASAAFFVLHLVGWTVAIVAALTGSNWETIGVADVLRGRVVVAPEVPQFAKGLRRFVRHPMTAGVLFALLCSPVWTVGRVLVLTLATTGLLLAARLNDADNAFKYRDAFITYMRSTPAIVPRTQPVVRAIFGPRPVVAVPAQNVLLA